MHQLALPQEGIKAERGDVIEIPLRAVHENFPVWSECSLLECLIKTRASLDFLTLVATFLQRY